MISLIVIAVFLVGFAVLAWLLQPKRETLNIAKHQMPKGLSLVKTPMADLEMFRFKPTPTTDTVYIPRVGPGQNKHYVDATAEMPTVRPVPGRHA